MPTAEFPSERLAQLRSWVECETPTAAADRVAAFATEVAAAFAAEGCRAIHHPQGLQLGWGEGERPILILGHLDTVYPVGTLATMPFRLEQGCAYGPGIYDMKGGLLLALHALALLRARPPGGERAPLVFLFVHDEEAGSPGSRPLTERLARGARAVLVLEPAAEGGKLKIARKGIAHYRLVAQGRAAHAGVDFEQGRSAIVALAAAITEVASWTDVARGITVNPGVIAGGTAANVVAARAQAVCDVRAWTLADLQELDRRFHGLGLEVGGGINRPPMEPTPASLALFAQARELGGEFGLELEAARTGGGSDGNFTAALGVPTLDGLGMVGAGAHAAHEHVRLDQFLPRARLLARLLATL